MSQWPEEHRSIAAARWLEEQRRRRARHSGRQMFFAMAEWIGAMASEFDARGPARCHSDIPFGVSYYSAKVFG